MCHVPVPLSNPTRFGRVLSSLLRDQGGMFVLCPHSPSFCMLTAAQVLPCRHVKWNKMGCKCDGEICYPPAHKMISTMLRTRKHESGFDYNLMASRPTLNRGSGLLNGLQRCAGQPPQSLKNDRPCGNKFAGWHPRAYSLWNDLPGLLLRA